MDDLTGVHGEPRSRTVLRFGPDRRLTVLWAIGAVALAVLCATYDDSLGRILFGLAAALLAGYAITDVVFSPRLIADPAGLVVRSPTARARLSWSEVEDVRADVRTRYGLRSVTLEIDAGERLVVLSARALGAAPETVAPLVQALDPRRWAGPAQ